jgi:glutamate dehydrogenase (NAD(P)+)
VENGGGRRPVRRREGRRQRSTPRTVDAAELQQVTRSFVDKIEKVLGPQRDFPAPDVGTNADDGVDDGRYGKLHGHTPAIVTRKPISLEGSYGREAATGRGLVAMFREAAPALGLSPADTRVVLQGFGNVGSWVARIMAQLGCTVIGASDSHGAIHADEGLDAETLQATSATAAGWARSRAAGLTPSPRRSCSGSSARSSCPLRSPA